LITAPTFIRVILREVAESMRRLDSATALRSAQNDDGVVWDVNARKKNALAKELNDENARDLNACKAIMATTFALPSAVVNVEVRLWFTPAYGLRVCWPSPFDR